MVQPRSIKKTKKTGAETRGADGGGTDKYEIGKMSGRTFGVQSLR
jgi:hypothetical protein